MSEHNQPPSSNRPAPDRLLSELESIKGTLSDQQVDAAPDQDDELPSDIPLLDDMVIHNLDCNSSLLNINRIFDDAESEPEQATAPPVRFPRFQLDVAVSDELLDRPASTAAVTQPSPTAPRQRVRPDYSRDVLIQELVDEFVPQIEAALRERLDRLDLATLRRLQDKQQV